MGRILISEDEKNRILGMHSKHGYQTINEQGDATAPTGTGNVSKAAEANNRWFQSDPVGKVLAGNKAFVDYVNKNNINIAKAGLKQHPQFSNNFYTSINGKNFIFNPGWYTGTISDVVTARDNAQKQLREKINQLNTDRVKLDKCFDTTLGKIADNKGADPKCSNVKYEFEAFKKQIKMDNLNGEAAVQIFLDNAPKWGAA